VSAKYSRIFELEYSRIVIISNLISQNDVLMRYLIEAHDCQQRWFGDSLDPYHDIAGSGDAVLDGGLHLKLMCV
jgi:hypothetical protein